MKSGDANDVTLRFAAIGVEPLRASHGITPKRRNRRGSALESTTSAEPRKVVRLYPDHRKIVELAVAVRWVLQRSDYYVVGWKSTDFAFSRDCKVH